MREYGHEHRTPYNSFGPREFAVTISLTEEQRDELDRLALLLETRSSQLCWEWVRDRLLEQGDPRFGGAFE